MSALQELAERVAAGDDFRIEDARAVLAGQDLVAIGMMADAVRQQLHGARTTFVRVLEVHADAVPQTLPARTAPGEIRITGKPGSLDAACAAVAAARALAADVPLTAFTLSDIASLGADAFRRLRDAGLDGVAEVVVTGEANVAELVTKARDAGLLVARATVHEAPDDPLGAVLRTLELQRAVGGIQAFAPLPRVMSVAQPTTGFDDVKLVAAARLLLRNVPSIQVDWPLYGPKLAQVALTMGADDVDGIAATEPGLLGARRSALEEIKGNILAAVLQAVERNGAFAAGEAVEKQAGV